MAVMKERNIRNDKAVTALVENNSLRLRDGDVHGWTDSVSAVWCFCGGNVSGQEVPTRNEFNAFAIGDDDLP